MKSKEVKIKYDEYQPGEIMDEPMAELIKVAENACHTSYAPYSEFRVGAAVRLDDNKIISGSNQENSAYPSGLCAERVAIFSAKSQFPDAIIESIAISAITDRFSINQPITPCGACRQVISETEKRQNKKIEVIMSAQNSRTIVVDGVDNLLPFKFQEEKLKKSK